MNPAIKRYLDEYGATYTPEALRKGLLDAGYDPAEVDAALSAWTSTEANQSVALARQNFARSALWLHVGAVVAVFVLIVALKGTTAIGSALLGCAVLAVVLVIGWAISSLIGRALLPATGAVVALIVPALSALLLGGSCFAILSSAIGTPPRQGTVSLEIDAPRAFQGSGGGNCYVASGTTDASVSSEPLGILDGKQVSAYVSWYGKGGGPAPGAAPASSVQVYVQFATADGALSESFGTIFSTRLEADVAADALTGTIRFEGLAAEPTGELGAPTSSEVISGSVSWDCE